MDTDRNPLRRIALLVGGVVAGLSAILSPAVLLGVLTNSQAATITTVGESLPGGVLAAGAVVAVLTAMAAALAAAFGVAKVGERSVTPTHDPRAGDGTKLVPDSPIAPGPDTSAPGYYASEA